MGGATGWIRRNRLRVRVVLRIRVSGWCLDGAWIEY